MYYLYVLLSDKYPRTYIGISADLIKRLREHNAGHVRSTKAYRPYQIVYQEEYAAKTEARKRELKFKNHAATKETLFRQIGLRA